jgi:hypothetical protein
VTVPPSRNLPMVIAGCSRRKSAPPGPVPALELYQGGCIPALRNVAETWPALRARTWIISAEHGLLHASTPLQPYDRRMDRARALCLRGLADQTLREDFTAHGLPCEVLVIAEPDYQLALGGLPALAGEDRVTWIDDPAGEWDRAASILDGWRKRSCD